MKRVTTSLAAIGILISALSSVAQNGIIRGTVVDEVGQPIQAAKVHAELHGVPMAKAIRYVESDENGAFAIDRLTYGTYDVNSGKQEDGYAERMALRRFERLGLKAGQPFDPDKLPAEIRTAVEEGIDEARDEATKAFRPWART